MVFLMVTTLFLDPESSTSGVEEFLVDNTLIWESTNWGDVLDMWVLLGGGVDVDSSNGIVSNSVDLLVGLGSLEVTLIFSSINCPLNGKRILAS